MNTIASLKNMAADPTQILQVGFGYWSSKVLLSAVKLGVFTALSDRSLTGEELAAQVNIHPRAIYDFFDTLVALGFLDRDGVGASGRYRNTPATAMYLDKQQPSYIGGILEMSNDRLFRFWADLDEALQTGKPQNELKHSQTSLFDTLYADPAKLELFLNGMTGISRGNFQALADKFDFSPYQTLCDVGGAAGILSTVVSQKYPHLQCHSFDLPPVAPIAQKSIDKESCL